MDDTKLGLIEAQFAELIWEREPLRSAGELVKHCQQEKRQMEAVIDQNRG